MNYIKTCIYIAIVAHLLHIQLKIVDIYNITPILFELLIIIENNMLNLEIIIRGRR